jgi:CheY-like chemotaxis protein
MNLCVNAKDAMSEGGTLRLSTRRLEDGRIELRARDNGHGMPPEVLERAMEPFFTTKPLGQGTGLGLAMVFGTVQAMGGTVELQSQPGRGTEAILRFPPCHAPGEAPDPPEPGPAAAPKALRILLVDDDELIRRAVVPMLTLLGHRIQAVAGGREALDLFEGGFEVDLVILDMNMPGLNGAETLRRLLRLRPEQAVLMASGYTDQDLTGLLAAHPRIQSIQKPFQLSELQVRLKAF